MPETTTPSLLQRGKLALALAKSALSADPQQLIGVQQAIASFMPSQRRNPPLRGTMELIQAYNEMPWLRAVVGKIAEAFASTTWHIYGTRQVGKRFHRERRIQRTPDWRKRQKYLKDFVVRKDAELVEIEDSPLLDLLSDPNSFHVGVASKKLWQIYFELSAEVFWVIERAVGGPRDGLPIGLWPMPSHWVLDTPSVDHPYYRVVVPNVGGRNWEIPQTEVLWLLDPDPVYPYRRGSGIARTLSDELETDEYAAKHAKQYFYNRARPDFVAWVKGNPGEGPVGQPKIDEIKQKWQQEFQGFFRTAKPHFVNYEMGFHEFTQNLEQQQLVEIRQAERDIILHTIGIPPEILGILESSNRSTIDSADYLMSRFVLQPRLEFWRSFLQERLVPLFDDRIIIDYDSPIPEDREFKLKVSTAHPYAFQVDEIRALADADALDDDKGKVFGVPVAITIHEELADATAANDGTGGDPAASGGEAALDIDSMLTMGADRRMIEKGQPEETYLAVQRIADRLEPRMRRLFLEAVAKVRSQLDLQHLSDALAGGNVQAALDSLHLERLEETLGGERGLASQLRQAVDAAAKEAANSLKVSAGIDIAFDVANLYAVQWVREHAGERITMIGDASRQAIREIIMDAVRLGGHPLQSAKKIRQYIGLTAQGMARAEKFYAKLVKAGASAEEIDRRLSRFTASLIRERAITIARTETIDAVNRGQQLLWEAGVRSGLLKETEWSQDWLVTPDDALDVEICEPMPEMAENKEVPIGGLFTTGDGRQIKGPTAHPRCRCAVALRRRKSIKQLPGETRALAAALFEV